MSISIELQTTPVRIADALRDAVMRGELEPGSPIREPQLVRSLGVSRNTVREALRLLAGEGLISHNAFRGVSVARLTEDDVCDLFRARLALELAGVDAAARVTPDQLGVLHEAAKAFEVAVRAAEWTKALDHDLRLHSGLVHAVGSRRLSESLVGVLRELRLGYFMYGGVENFMYRGFESESIPKDLEEHRRIVELVDAGDSEEARAVIRAHLERSQELLLQRVRARHAEERAA